MQKQLQQPPAVLKKKAAKVGFLSIIVLLIGWGICFYKSYHTELKKNVNQFVALVDELFELTEQIIEKSIPLLDKPCDEVEQQLRINALALDGIRSINLVSGPHIYCSSIISQINQPIDLSIPEIQLSYPVSSVVNKVPVIRYFRLVKQQGILVTLSTEYIHVGLIQSSSIKNHGDYQLIIGTNLLYKGELYPAPLDNHYLFSIVEDSQKYPFSIVNGYTWYDFYQDISMRMLGIVSIILLILLAGFFVQVIVYQYLTRKSFTLLDKAIKAGDIFPYVQPVVNAQNSEWVAVEVLARWKESNTGTFISPEVFIPVAERSQLIIPMTSAFMKKVADCLVLIEDQLPDIFKVSFNISADNCKDLTLFDDCVTFLNRFSHNKIILVLELTEREFIEPTDFTNNLFEKLRGINVEFALDDFGTRHSNLSYFDKFKINHLKIDSSFAAKVDGSGLTRILVENILALAKSLKIPVIVEGIETKQQRDYFLSCDVLFQQGYLFAKPMSLEQFEQYFTSSIQKTIG